MYRANKIARACLPALLAGLVLAAMLACGGGTSATRESSGDSSFNLELSPSTLAFARGNQNYTTLTTRAVGDFSGSITPAAAGVPDGVTITFDPAIIPPSGSSKVSVALDSRTKSGTYAIAVSASADGIVKNATLSLTVTAGDSSFSLELSPSTLAFARGNQNYATLTTRAVGDFSGVITPAAAGVPDGVTITFDPANLPPTGASNVTVALAPGTTTGTYVIAVTGSADGIVKSATLSLTVGAQVNLTWEASHSRDVIGYYVGRSTTSGSGYVRLNSQLISETSYVDQTAESNHTYYYVVTAVDSADRESAPSNQACATVR